LADRKFMNQRVGTGWVELGEHVVEQQNWWMTRAIGQELMNREPQAQRKATLLALGRFKPRVSTVELDDQVITVWAHRGGCSTEILVTGLEKRLGIPTGPARLVTEKDFSQFVFPGECTVGPYHQRDQFLDQSASGFG
jgi:hypothetical protein